MFWVLNPKLAFLHVPMRPKVKRFLRFHWRGKQCEWQGVPFSLNFSPQILIFMVKRFLVSISLTAYMDDFTNKAKCEFKVIYQIHVIALVFMCCGSSINWVKTFLDPASAPIHLGFLWYTLEGTVTLPEDKTTLVETSAKKLLVAGSITQK